MKLIMKFEELPEDFEEQLTYNNHRKQLQRESDDKWRARVEAQGSDDEKEARPLIDVNDITRDFLSSDQSFIFSDEMTIYDQKIITCNLAIVDQRVYILFNDKAHSNLYTPFDLEELQAVVMSPSNPMSAAFKMKDQKKLNRSHIVFQN